MITEDYCSFEVAKLLKEKGFDSPCMGRYSVRSKEFHLDCTKMCNNGGLFECAAPSQAMAMKWLREKDIRICPDYSDVDGKWFTMIGTKKKRTYSGYYDTYEEAVEKALKYSLENLI